MHTNRFKPLLDHYQHLPLSAAGVPRRTDFRPGAVTSILPWLFMVRLDDTGLWRVSLAGSAIEHVLGVCFGNKGQWPGPKLESYDNIASFLKMLVKTPCGGQLTLDIEARGITHTNMEILFLPLASPDGTRIERLIGMLLLDTPRNSEPFPTFATADEIMLKTVHNLCYHPISENGMVQMPACDQDQDGVPLHRRFAA